MVLLVAGLADGSSLLLIVSIAASLLAAVALVVGARQAAASRAAAERPPSETDRGGGSADRQPGSFMLPGQHFPPLIDHGGTGWRQPPGPPVAVSEPVANDEPAPQSVSPAEAARLARLGREVWVVDAHPRYHLAGCSRLLGEPEPLPVAEAVDLGFTPCAHCAPVATLLTEEGRIASGGAGA
ncbi:hypothetical protein [Salinispora cortesiana]|uniref:hypothetical protein n=1 Tax=Salinispora cortesiana TaxID=1305843 RepID=UPI00165EDBF9|nr:hypothetical protein [Salinispora cortesiana]